MCSLLRKPSKDSVKRYVHFKLISIIGLHIKGQVSKFKCGRTKRKTKEATRIYKDRYFYRYEFTLIEHLTDALAVMNPLNGLTE